MKDYNGTEVAIIGLSCQVPGANNLDDFWDNLKNSIESISFFSDEELLEEGIDRDLLKNPLFVKANSFITNKEYFDSDFFGYRPAEVKLMDPQLRIFHEHCWKALEDAGYGNENREKKIGLFAGGEFNINWMNYAILTNLENEVDDFTASQLRNINFLCSKVSYALNLQGPSVFLNTACSTSLVAIQKATMSLLLRECNMALAGGVKIMNFSKKGYLFQEGMINSKDGHCRPFDAEASGTVSGEGVGVVVLKRLIDAIKDGDNIYAIIKGSGINNDGAEKMAYTAPSVHGQSKVITKAINMARINPDSVSYIEAHGTATSLGDPIEIEALKLAYGNTTGTKCALGSVKSNIGHLDNAAGVVGLIKTVLSLKYKLIPPNIHYFSPNPNINFENSRFFVNTELREWNSDKYPLRAGISSFGIGGTNVHMILEEAPQPKQLSESRTCQLLLLSAKTKTALERNIENLRDFLIKEQDLNLEDVAYTLQVGRTDFIYRKMIICNDREEAIELLSGNKEQHKFNLLSENKKNKIIFMFSGQGSQYENMCFDLYETEPVFKKEIDKCFDIVKCISGKDLKPIIFPDDKFKKIADIDETEFTQPALFIIEYALTQLLNEWGVKPDIMIGHSIGEYVAACISGVFSLEDALQLVVNRGELMQNISKGNMLAVTISEADLVPLLKDYKDLSIAAVNSTDLCVVSGNKESIDMLRKHIGSIGYNSKKIRTSHAFHSVMMDGILNEFEKVIKGVSINSQQIPFISNLTGKIAKDSEIKHPQYWVNHLRNTVRFSDGVETLLNERNGVFVEIGPGKSLTNLIRSNKAFGHWHKVINLVKHPLETRNDLYYILSGIGKLWLNGVNVNWDNHYKDKTRNRVSLPTYSFDKIKYLAIVDSFEMISTMLSNKFEVKEKDITEWFYTPSWKLSHKIHKGTDEKKSLINLIFINNLVISNSLIDEFYHQNQKIVIVGIKDSFIKESSTSYFINPNNDDDYRRMFENLMEDGLFPDRIIHGWGISELIENKMTNNEFLQYCNVFFYSLINIIKASQNYGGILGKQISVLSNDLHNIIENKPIPVVKSLVLGLLKVIPQEFPTVSCSHIDVSLSEIREKGFIKRLYDEINHSQSGKVVSIRNSQRWIQIWDKIIFEKEENPSNFSKNGVYLITGGLDNIGFNLAKNIITKYDAKIILLGRTDLPLRKDWDEILKLEDISDDLKVKIRKIQSLENEGGEVLYLKCNIADKKELADSVKISEDKFGLINGVIHTVGVINGRSHRPLLELKKEAFEIQFESQINGLEALNDVFRDKMIDFGLVTSSLSAQLGGIGFAEYATANLCMDYYIKSQNEINELTNWMSVNLDEINFDESQTSNVIDANVIFDVINQALSLKCFSQIVVSTRDLNTRLEKWINTKYTSGINKNEVNELGFKDVGLNDMENISEDGLTSTEKELLKLWQNFFGKSDIRFTDDFFELGGDSLKALTMIGKIHKIFNIELPIKEFFKNTTIRDISNFIDTNKWLSHKNDGTIDQGKTEITL
jgi:acyl transferase domain-containing protein/acyl carrier protein